MKNLLFFILSLSQISLNAQDTIYKRNGEIISTKVIEINLKEVTYKRSDLLDGPLFISNINEIRKIKYYNGAIDTFSIVKEIIEPAILPNRPLYIVQNDINEIQPTYRKGIFLYQGKQISDRNVIDLVSYKNQLWKNSDITYYSAQYKKSKALQYAIGFGGAAVGGLAMGGSLISTSFNSSNSDNVISASVAILGASVFVASQIVSATFKFKAIKHSNKLVELFNQSSRNQ